MLNRRNFLKSSLMAAVGGALLPLLLDTQFSPDDFEIRVYATMCEFLTCDLEFIRNGSESYSGQKVITRGNLPRIRDAVQDHYDFCKKKYGWQFVVRAGQNA